MTTGADNDTTRVPVGWNDPAPTGPWAGPSSGASGTPSGTWGGPTTQPQPPRRAFRWPHGVGAGVLLLLQGLRLGLLTSHSSTKAAIALVGGMDLLVVVLIAVSYKLTRRSPGRFRFAQMGGVVGGVVVVSIVALMARSVLPSRTHAWPVPGAAGYRTYGGPTGKPLLVGAPWGRPCQPVVFWVAPGMPAAVYTEIETTVFEARQAGIDVTINEASPNNDLWEPNQLYPSGQNNTTVKFVWIYPHTNNPPMLSDGKPEHIGFGWDARSTADRGHEQLTSMDADLYLREVQNDPQKIHLATRQLIAFAQGVGSTTASGSGIARGTRVDGFSPADLKAMQAMSGCDFAAAPAGPPFYGP